MFIVNTEAAIYRDGRYLICKRTEREEHEGSELSLVGGKVELEGHSSDVSVRTIVREVEEEVGLNFIGKLHYVHSTSFVTVTGAAVVNVSYLCENFAGVPYAVSPD